MKAGKLVRAGIMAALALLWGLSCRLKPQETPLMIEASLYAHEDGEGLAVAWPGETAAGGIRFCNRGRTGCRLRARLWTPEAEGRPAAEFVHSAGKGSGWRREGEYLVYFNDSTGGMLLPGQWTPDLYSEIQVAEELGELAGEELAVFVTLEGKGAEEEAWAAVKPEALP